MREGRTMRLFGRCFSKCLRKFGTIRTRATQLCPNIVREPSMHRGRCRRRPSRAGTLQRTRRQPIWATIKSHQSSALVARDLRLDRIVTDLKLLVTTSRLSSNDEPDAIIRIPVDPIRLTACASRWITNRLEPRHPADGCVPQPHQGDADPTPTGTPFAYLRKYGPDVRAIQT